MNDPYSKIRPSTNQASQNRNQPNRPARSGRSEKKRSFILPVLLIAVGCVVFLFAAWSAVNSPVLASIMSVSQSPQEAQQPGQANFFAQVVIPKPTYTPIPGQSIAQVILPTPTFSAVPEVVATNPPLVISQVQDVPTLDVVIVPPDPASTDDPQISAEVQQPSSDSVISAAIVADTPTAEYAEAQPATESAASVVPITTYNSGSGEHWIDVDLSQQRLYAYEGDTVVNTFVVSTGVWQTPTVTGKYKIWIKLRSAPMSGPGYYLPDVPYIMYFYKGYGLHGTYWHNNFGTPMSHGCVNLSIPDAEWVYNFTQVGTVVNVHY